ncbi:MAG TPA: alcohol dehydrogenase catalytic domain-containing protein [Pseudolysinimonas sp.]|nr:alcohol dehydrogenase catalytic domain-containing protein [Pseudolysinimonas sp.]
MIDRPGVGGVREVADPEPGQGDVLVAVSRAGLCGTDRELWDGSLAAQVGADLITYPRIPGHEWSGRIVGLGQGVDPDRAGERVLGDTFVGCGSCDACRSKRVPACAQRAEIGVRGRDGALAELLVVPATNALPVPASVTDAAAALVEPLSNAVRAVDELRQPAHDLLVRGAGTLGLLAARVANVKGMAVAIVDKDPDAVARARALGFPATESVASGRRFDGLIDMAPGRGAADLIGAVRDGGSIVITGFPDPAELVALRLIVDRDIRVTGTLGAPRYLGPALRLLAAGTIAVKDLVSPPMRLVDVAAHLGGVVRSGAAKVQVAPQSS